MKALNRYDYIVSKAKKPAKSWSNKELMQFHYFNPNGLIAAKDKNDHRIRILVNAGVIASGWHMAFGSFADFEYKEIMRLAILGDRVSSSDARVAIKMMENHIAKVSSRLDEVEK